MITVQLTVKQAHNLADILNQTADEGPMYAGWASDKLCELRGIIDEAIARGLE